MSLVDLAVDGNLPSQQYIDSTTLEWIKDQNPFSTRYDISHFAELVLTPINDYIPNSEWFPTKKRINALHGIRHLMRVTIYAYLLIHTQKMNGFEQVVCTAASIHDLRRENDKKDIGHAKRSADWFIQNLPELEKRYSLSFDKQQVIKIFELIRMHEQSTTSQSTNQTLFILKTADALDRYIQPKLKWWIDETQLTIKPSPQIKFFAYNLILHSERNFLENHDSVHSVLTALEQIKNAN